MKKLTIQVTQDDIDSGTPGSASDCAICKTLERMGYTNPVVDEVAIDFACEATNQHFSYSMTRKSIRFITKFDATGEFEDAPQPKPISLTFRDGTVQPHRLNP